MKEGHQYTIIIATSHQEPKTRVNGIAPMGYGFVIVHGDQADRHFGFGGERSTEAMFAHGLTHAASEIFVDCEEPHITVVAANIGTEKYVTEFVPKWLKDQPRGGAKDNERTWRDVHAISAMGNLVLRTPADELEQTSLLEVQKLAKDSAGRAYRYLLDHPAQRGQAGIIATDQDLQSAAE